MAAKKYRIRVVKYNLDNIWFYVDLPILPVAGDFLEMPESYAYAAQRISKIVRPTYSADCDLIAALGDEIISKSRI